MLNTTKATPAQGCVVLGILALLLASPFLAYPFYKRWSRDMRGQATLREAEWTRKIRIEEAKAEQEAAKALAAAEIERAKGVAEANRIIGESLTGNEAYLRYLWIQGLQDGSSEVIYVPTEAGLPILEAGKR